MLGNENCMKIRRRLFIAGICYGLPVCLLTEKLRRFCFQLAFAPVAGFSFCIAVVALCKRRLFKA